MVDSDKNSWDMKKLTRQLKRCFSSHDVAVGVVIEPLAQMLMDNPDKALDLVCGKYNEALDKAYTDEDGKNQRAFVEAFAGGPHEGVPRATANAIGAVYPFLDRNRRDKGLRELLNIFDGINYAYVNGMSSAGFTPGIREPLLLSDISITRFLYWPGMDEGKNVLARYSNFFDLQKDIIDEEGLFRKNKVASDFIMGYSLLRKDFCNFGEDYISLAEPDFLNRTLKGIVGLRFGRELKEGDIEKGEARLRELLPKSVHDRITSLRLEADWVDYRKFT